MARVEKRMQQLDAGISFDSKRRHLLLGVRNEIIKMNPKLSVSKAYEYAELIVNASEKYPSVDPLLLLSVGKVESRFEVAATSQAGARGLYQIWPATGRLLVRSLGWEYDDRALYDPERNNEMAALYLDMLYATYSDTQLVLAEYNGGPLNAAYYRTYKGRVATETREYVAKVQNQHHRLQRAFSRNLEARFDSWTGESSPPGIHVSPHSVDTDARPSEDEQQFYDSYQRCVARASEHWNKL